MKAMLLRVGIDKGTNRTLEPIFEGGSFGYISISEKEAIELGWRKRRRRK